MVWASFFSRNFENCCPISILSNISKIFEKVMYHRIYSFLCKHNLSGGFRNSGDRRLFLKISTYGFFCRNCADRTPDDTIVKNISLRWGNILNKGNHRERWLCFFQYIKVNKSVYIANCTYRFRWQYAIILVWKTWSRALNQLI